MTISAINPHDAREKTSIAYAFAQGYTITPDGDGCGQMLTPRSDVYHIHEWQCDCADAFGRNGGTYELPDGRRACKHILWLSQCYPCEKCGSTMLMNTETSWRLFVCICCGKLDSFQRIKAERQQAFRQREQEGDTLKTHAPTPAPETETAILERAEAASEAIFAD